jgi:hypothetical protein
VPISSSASAATGVGFKNSNIAMVSSFCA